VCQLKVRRKKQTNPNHVVIRCAEKTVVQGHASDTRNYVRVRFPKLDQKYPFKESPGLPKNCFVAAISISPETTELCFYNYSGQEFILPKDYKLGYIELLEAPQYTPVKPVDVVQCHFRKATEPLRSSTVTKTATNEVATAPISTTASRQVPKKTSSPLGSISMPRCTRCPPPSLRTSVRPSFSLVRSFLPPLHRPPFFFYQRPFFSRPLPWKPPFGIPHDCQNMLFFPPKPGLQLQLLVKLFTCAINC